MIFCYFITKDMAYYELCQKGRSTQTLEKERVVFTLIMKAFNADYIIVLSQSGQTEIYELQSLSSIGRLSISCKQKNIKNILAYSISDSIIILFTFRQIYLLDAYLMLEIAIMEKIKTFEVKSLRFVQSQAHIENQFLKLTNKQLKLINFRQRLYLKIIGRLNDDMRYLFCQIKGMMLQIVETYNIRLKYQYKASIQSLDKDIIFYQSYVNKASLIKVHHVTYHSHTHGRDTEVTQDYEVYQFQEKCCVNNIQKISGTIICIFTNTHFQFEYQSNIILYNIQQKYAMCNITLKDFLIMEATLSGFDGKRYINYGDYKLMIECIGQEGQRMTLRQVCPLSNNTSSSIQIPPSNYYYIHPKCFILHTKECNNIVIHRKVQKKAIYFSWLLQKYQTASSIFGEILELF